MESKEGYVPNESQKSASTCKVWNSILIRRGKYLLITFRSPKLLKLQYEPTWQNIMSKIDMLFTGMISHFYPAHFHLKDLIIYQFLSLYIMTRTNQLECFGQDQ